MRLEFYVEGTNARELYDKAHEVAEALAGPGMKVEDVTMSASGYEYVMGMEVPITLRANVCAVINKDLYSHPMPE